MTPKDTEEPEPRRRMIPGQKPAKIHRLIEIKLIIVNNDEKMKRRRSRGWKTILSQLKNPTAPWFSTSTTSPLNQ